MVPLPNEQNAGLQYKVILQPSQRRGLKQLALSLKSTDFDILFPDWPYVWNKPPFFHNVFGDSDDATVQVDLLTIR